MPVEANFNDAVIARSHERPVVVAFISGVAPLLTWVENVLAHEIRKRGEPIELAIVDTDRDARLAARHGVRLIPTLQGYRHGEQVAGLISATAPEAVAAFLDSLLAPRDAERLREELRAEHEWPEVVAALDEGNYERALESLLARAAHGGRAERERVRRLMLSLFAELGDKHPLSARYRRRLAATLY